MKDEWRPLDVDRLDAALLDEANRFALRRRVQGFRLEPVDLGRVLLEHNADAQAVRISVDDFKLDPETALVQIRTYTYEYRH